MYINICRNCTASNIVTQCQQYIIAYITITADTVNDFVIETLNTAASKVALCARMKQALKLGESKFIPCRQNVTGSLVRVRLAGHIARSLTLCEVQVYGRCK